MNKPTLPIYERAFALGVVGFFAWMIFLNYWLYEKEPTIEKGEPIYVQNPLIEVTIEGKVLKPGVYQVKRGTLVREVLDLAVPAEDANTGRMNLDSKILRRRKIKIR